MTSEDVALVFDDIHSVGPRKDAMGETIVCWVFTRESNQRPGFLRWREIVFLQYDLAQGQACLFESTPSPPFKLIQCQCARSLC